MHLTVSKTVQQDNQSIKMLYSNSESFKDSDLFGEYKYRHEYSHEKLFHDIEKFITTQNWNK